MNCNNQPKCEKLCGDCTQEWPVPAGAQSPAEGDEVRDAAQALINHLWKTQLAGIHFHLVADLKQALDAKPQPKHTDEPLFLLHCGQIDSGGEQGDWDIEADSGKRVDEFCSRHPGQTVKLYPHVQAPAPAPDVDVDGGNLPCPRCSGSGFELQWSDASPDAHQVEVNCDHCDGAGSLGAAYTHLSQMLKRERERSKKHTDELHWLKSGPFFGLRADKSIQNVADRLDELADACGKYDPRSERASDIRAAATTWRKHLAGPVPCAAVKAEPLTAMQARHVVGGMGWDLDPTEAEDMEMLVKAAERACAAAWGVKLADALQPPVQGSGK